MSFFATFQCVIIFKKCLGCRKWPQFSDLHHLCYFPVSDVSWNFNLNTYKVSFLFPVNENNYVFRILSINFILKMPEFLEFQATSLKKNLTTTPKKFQIMYEYICIYMLSVCHTNGMRHWRNIHLQKHEGDVVSLSTQPKISSAIKSPKPKWCILPAKLLFLERERERC